jgi:glucose-1-phosphate cytidylyltransferase
MKAVIFAGGLGTRLSEETLLRPKPMVEIGGKPILWHIMNLYSAHGINDFIICLGYKGYVIKEYFANYFLHQSDVTFNLRDNTSVIHGGNPEPWKVTLVDTGENSGTGGRFARVSKFIEDDDAVCLTYGDGLSDVDITATIAFHRSHGRGVTVTAVKPPGRFGSLELRDSSVLALNEKPLGDGGWVNGGFFVVSPTVAKYVGGDLDSWETDVLDRAVVDDQLRAYEHHGFWQPMDTLRDKQLLEELWRTGSPPWSSWESVKVGVDPVRDAKS